MQMNDWTNNGHGDYTLHRNMFSQVDLNAMHIRLISSAILQGSETDQPAACIRPRPPSGSVFVEANKANSKILSKTFPVQGPTSSAASSEDVNSKFFTRANFKPRTYNLHSATSRRRFGFPIFSTYAHLPLVLQDSYGVSIEESGSFIKASNLGCAVIEQTTYPGSL